jgi:hypothetical protein
MKVQEPTKRTPFESRTPADFWCNQIKRTIYSLATPIALQVVRKLYHEILPEMEKELI